VRGPDPPGVRRAPGPEARHGLPAPRGLGAS
jgi:hypothetical protein